MINSFIQSHLVDREHKTAPSRSVDAVHRALSNRFKPVRLHTLFTSEAIGIRQTISSETSATLSETGTEN